MSLLNARPALGFLDADDGLGPLNEIAHRGIPGGECHGVVLQSPRQNWAHGKPEQPDG